MLVIASDLHLTDGSAGAHNVPAEAFADWLHEILVLARHNEAKEIVFVYLGDIVDFLRTEYWFYSPHNPSNTFPLGDRPWGDPDSLENGDAISQACRDRAFEIWKRIRGTCKDQLALMSGDLTALTQGFQSQNGEMVEAIRDGLNAYGDSIRRYYVPGNHDRLYLVDNKLKNAVDAAMGVATAPQGDFHGRYYESARYGVMARHGHEVDLWNFESYEEDADLDSVSSDAYELTPVGDPITTELAARVPYEVRRDLEAGNVDPRIVDDVYLHLQNIENVRPLHAGVKWVLVELARLPGGKEVRRKVMDSVRRVANDFWELPFVQGWNHKHDRFGFDETTKLWAAIKAIDKLKPGAVVSVVEQLGRSGVLGADGDEDHIEAAMRERSLRPSGAERGIRYCVYGHTHGFNHVPLLTLPDGHETVYFNTGTWRPRLLQTQKRDGFVQVKEMNYVVFYADDEDMTLRGAGKKKGLSYETWNGLMLKRTRG